MRRNNIRMGRHPVHTNNKFHSVKKLFFRTGLILKDAIFPEFSGIFWTKIHQKRTEKKQGGTVFSIND